MANQTGLVCIDKEKKVWIRKDFIIEVVWNKEESKAVVVCADPNNFRLMNYTIDDIDSEWAMKAYMNSLLQHIAMA